VIIEDGVLQVLDTLEVKPNGTNAIDKRFIVLEEGLLNATLISYHDWRLCLLQHHHECLEVLFTPRNLYLCETEKIKLLHGEFVLDKDMLRRTAAWESKRRFTRALYPAKDSMRRGKKDLVHALRYLLFALQMFANDRIVDFTAANNFYRKIVLETDDVNTEAEFKLLMQKWEPERYRLSHELGDARLSRRFYCRTDTERRFLANCRAKNQFSIVELDKRRFSLFSPLHRTNAPNPIDHPLQILDEALCTSENGLLSLEDEYQVVWFRDQANPNTLIVYPHRNIRQSSTPLLQAIANGAVIQQGSNNDGSYSILSLGLPSISSNLALSPEDRRIWNERLSDSDSSKKYAAEEMIDGTHVTMFFHNGEWKIASRIEPLNPSMSLSYTPINDVNHEISLHDEFWRIWKLLNYETPTTITDTGVQEICFTFILNSDIHRHVVCYDLPNILLVHARNILTGKVVDQFQWARLFRWKVPNTLNPLPSTLEELERQVFNLNPLFHKGYVLKSIVDGQTTNWNAITIKNSIYTSIRYGTDFETIGQLNMRVEVDRKSLLAQAVYSTGSRFLEAFPFWKNSFDSITNVYHEFCDHLDSVYRPHCRKPRKEFVTAVGDFEFCQTLFRMYQNRYPSTGEYFALLPLKQQFMYRPWRQYLQSRHPALFKFFQGEDEDIESASSSQPQGQLP
jgi:hypothetical protein